MSGFQIGGSQYISDPPENPKRRAARSPHGISSAYKIDSFSQQPVDRRPSASTICIAAPRRVRRRSSHSRAVVEEPSHGKSQGIKWPPRAARRRRARSTRLPVFKALHTRESLLKSDVPSQQSISRSTSSGSCCSETHQLLEASSKEACCSISWLDVARLESVAPQLPIASRRPSEGGGAPLPNTVNWRCGRMD